MESDRDKHRFVVTAVELAEEDEATGVAVRLTDVRGGQVTLELNDDMAELLRQKVAAAVERKAGP